MKKDITDGRQVTIISNLEYVDTLITVIRDMLTDSLEDRRLIGYYGDKIITLTHMVDGYVQESLACAEQLEVITSES